MGLFQEFDNKDPDTELKTAITRIMRALLKNMDDKSKQYEDAALTQLFLMNNVNYVVRFVRRFGSNSLKQNQILANMFSQGDS